MNFRYLILPVLIVLAIGTAAAAPVTGTTGDISNASYVIETVGDLIDSILNEPTGNQSSRYISQGDEVYLGEYIDISGVAPPYESLAYWDGYDMYDSAPSYNITLPNNKKGYYRFYIDPKIFKTRTGWWYKYDGKFERQGNNRAFRVNGTPNSFNYTITFSNGTTVEMVANRTITVVETPKVITPEPLLPEKHEADYVVAKGDGLMLPNGNYQVWVIGRSSGIYALQSHLITKDQITALESGNYKLVFQYAGRNTIYDATCFYVYNNTPIDHSSYCSSLIPGLYGKKPVDVYGYSPTVVYDKLTEMLEGTDDYLDEYTLVVDNPYITIHQADEKEYLTHHVLNVRGYTNAAAGTEISVTLNEKNTYYKDVAKMQTKTVAVRTSPGNLSYYSANVPFDWDDLAADARNHTLIARTALGGSVQKDFKVSLMPADSYRPNASLKYIEDRNPFVPTPTPIVVTQVVTQVVVQTVTIPVTPSDEQVFAQQKAAEDAKWNEAVNTVGERALMLILGILLALSIWYFVSVYKRAKRNE